MNPLRLAPCLLLALACAPLAQAETRGRILDRNGIVLAETDETGKRQYPLAEAAGHLTGYLKIRSSEGASGLEKAFDKQLAEGTDLALTIDVELQQVVRDAFPEDWDGAVVVIDPQSGAVLAMASFPGFDPGDFVPSIRQEDWKAYSEDPRRPLLPRTIQQTVPGSLYKIPTALAAEKAGLAGEMFTCEGGVDFGKRRLKCWSAGTPEGSLGELDLSGAIQRSCNSFFYEVAREAGIEPIEEVADLLGLFDPTGCGMPNESAGERPSEFFQRRDVPMSSTDHAINAIGQGVVTASPVQMASVAATLANGGTRYQVHLVQRDDPEALAVLVDEGISADHVELVRKAMWRAVNEEDGSASVLRSDEIEIAGKSATAQTGRPDQPQHAWFMGFAPYEDPKLAVCVFVEGGKAGSWVAGPVAHQVLLEGLPIVSRE